jgi:hypothetical protein
MTNFDRGGRKARAGYSPSLGPRDPRLRTNAVSGRTGDDLGDGLSLDRQGRQVIRVDDASGLKFSPDGKLSLDHDILGAAVAASTTFNTTIVSGGTGGGGGTTIINNFLVDDTLAGYAL